MPEHWSEIHAERDLNKAIDQSHEEVVGLFKHSTRCSRSHAALHNLKGSRRQDVSIYYLDLLAYRYLSDLIAQKFGVVHQSPQLILLKHGKVLGHASHESISLERMLENERSVAV